jgi:hypothetical protein
VVRINEQKGRHSAGFRLLNGTGKRMSRLGRLAERDGFEPMMHLQ